jgi:DNA protecting protein DprA
LPERVHAANVCTLRHAPGKRSAGRRRIGRERSGVLTNPDLARLALSTLHGIGTDVVRKSFAVPLPKVLSAGEALKELAPRLAASARQRALDEARRIVDASQDAGIRIVPVPSTDYPTPLRTIGNPPPFLHVAGVLPARWESVVAVVGTRKPDPDSLEATDEIVRALAIDPACIVVSGLALGIDTAAHLFALQQRLCTIAVLAHGLDTAYPQQNDSLAKRIRDEGGCLVSETPVGAGVTRARLIARDRLQSGLSTAVFLVQSALEGGSMHTARFALQQGRPLIALAVPTPPSAEWSGNFFLTDDRPRRGFKAKQGFSRFPRPYALRMPRHDIRSFVQAGLGARYIPKAPSSGASDQVSFSAHMVNATSVADDATSAASAEALDTAGSASHQPAEREGLRGGRNVIDLDSVRRLRAAKDSPAYEPDFVKVLLTEDDIGAVVRAHIYAEYRLGVLLRKRLGAESYDDRPLADKINLAYSKQVIDADGATTLRALNRLRNAFAHQLDYEITPDRLQKFVSELRGVTVELYEDSFEPEDAQSPTPGRERVLLRLALNAIDSAFLDL